MEQSLLSNRALIRWRPGLLNTCVSHAEVSSRLVSQAGSSFFLIFGPPDPEPNFLPVESASAGSQPHATLLGRRVKLSDSIT